MSTCDNEMASIQLTAWLREATSLMIYMALGNPKAALQRGLGDFYRKQEGAAEPRQRNTASFVDLLVRYLPAPARKSSAVMQQQASDEPRP